MTVDCVVKCPDNVLLIRRGQAPGKGLLAVPGGFLEQRETTLQAALRELDEETHLALPPATLRACLRATDVFDQPDRSAARPHHHARSLLRPGRARTAGRCRPTTMPPPPNGRRSASWRALEDRFLDDHFQMLDHYLDLLPALSRACRQATTRSHCFLRQRAPGACLR